MREQSTPRSQVVIVYRDQEDVPVARVRADLDKYRTPDWMTEALVSSFPAIKGSVLCDPCCGDGRMSMTLAPRFDGLIASDIDVEDVQAARDWTRNRFVTRQIAQADLTLPAFTSRQITNVQLLQHNLHQSGFEPSGVWTITNPPFKHALEVARCALAVSHQVALLMRATWLEPTEARRDFLLEHPPEHMLYLPRWSFDGGGSDSVSCCWFIWGYPADVPAIRVWPSRPSRK